ncbi:MAG: ferredoxin [Cyanobacteria bacterium]|jgi:(2Fe-2S) ferredoxin|nr:ferredoxin [Cyanobacteria bacterium GSL.Bin1]
MEETANVNKECLETLQTTVERLGLQKIQRHLFLCADQTKPKCCSREEGLATWNYLKQRLQELGLDDPKADSSCLVFRTKANCLRVCCSGPILLIYPDGIWYHRVTPSAIERIIQEHLLKNQVVEDHLFFNHALPTPN